MLLTAKSVVDTQVRARRLHRRRPGETRRDAARRARAAQVKPYKGTVRGTLLTSGYYGRQQPGDANRTRVFYVIQADPAGILPKWLVNMCATRQAANVERLADIYRSGALQL